MARKAREKYEQGTFLISQNGNTFRDLFQNDDDRRKFLSILNKNKDKFKFKLYAYCIGAPNHYDLVIDVNGSDLSKIMKSINIAYAMYAKSEQKIFKDRYKSSYLKTETEIDEIVLEIEKRKTCSGDISQKSFNQWRECFSKEVLSLDLKDISFEDCNYCINCMDIAKKKLEDLAKDEAMPVEKLISDKDKRNQLIVNFRKYSTLSLKEIGELFGGLSESSVCKIINCE